MIWSIRCTVAKQIERIRKAHWSKIRIHPPEGVWALHRAADQLTIQGDDTSLCAPRVFHTLGETEIAVLTGRSVKPTAELPSTLHHKPLKLEALLRRETDGALKTVLRILKILKETHDGCIVILHFRPISERHQTLKEKEKSLRKTKLIPFGGEENETYNKWKGEAL